MRYKGFHMAEGPSLKAEDLEALVAFAASLLDVDEFTPIEGPSQKKALKALLDRRSKL